MTGEPEGDEGEVTVAVEGEEPRTAHAAPAARFDPLAGHVVRSGRVAAEHDVRGNTRVVGLDRPPFPVELPDVSPGCARSG